MGSLRFLSLLPRASTTFLFALAALLRFYGSTDTTILPTIPLTLLGWSLAAFLLATAFLLVDLGIEWNRRNRTRNRSTQRAQLQNGCLVGLAEFQLSPGETAHLNLAVAARLLKRSLDVNAS